MPEWFSLLVLFGGLAIFIASMLYAREYLRFKQANRESIELMRRATEASYLAPEEREREFAEISRIGWGRLGQSSPVYERYLAKVSAASAKPKTYNLGGLITELADLQRSTGLDSPEAREKLARLKQQLDRPAG